MFSVSEFEQNPSARALVDLTKAQWFELAIHYQIPAAPSLRKHEVRDIVINGLVSQDVIQREDLGTVFASTGQVSQMSNVSETMSQSQIDLEREKIAVERIKAENERMRLTHNMAEDITHFKLQQAIKFVPKFNEEEPDWFFTHFERTALLHGWPKDKWMLLIDSAFVGRAQEVFTAIDLASVQDYEYVKKAILNVYEGFPRLIGRSSGIYVKRPNKLM